jgi:hypothetical protein
MPTDTVDLTAIAVQLDPHFDALIELSIDNQQIWRTQERLQLDAHIAKINAEFRAELIEKGMLVEKWVEGRSGQKVLVDELTEEGRALVESLRKEEGAEALERQEKRQRANREIKRLLDGITEENYPRGDPETPRKMYELFGRISALYHHQGGSKRRSAESILRYLRGALENVWWMWAEWICACIAHGDYLVAEAMLQAAWSNTQFAKYAAGLHGQLVAARGVLYLVRDEDFPKALEWMETARDRHASDLACMSLYRQLRIAEKNGVGELAPKLIEPRALVTKEWNHDGFQRQIEGAAREREFLLLGTGAESDPGDDD